VPGCQYVVTRAITINVPPEGVWPWLTQVGFSKAGFYSNDLLDNVGHPSVDQIIEEYQHPQVGEWIPMSRTANDTTAFKVAAPAPADYLLWSKPESTWVWKLTARDRGTRRDNDTIGDCINRR
jgi:hypothetical protein